MVDDRGEPAAVPLGVAGCPWIRATCRAPTPTSTDPPIRVRRPTGWTGWRPTPASGRARPALDLLGGASPCSTSAAASATTCGRWALAAFGVDPSRTMIGRVGPGRAVRPRRRRAPPFLGGSFGGVRADRVLQHVVDPTVVVAELVRVDPGRWVRGPDRSRPVDAADRRARPRPGRVVERFRATGIRHGFLAERDGAPAGGAGCQVLGQERFPLVLTRPADAFGIPTWAQLMEARGDFDSDQARRFEATLAPRPATGRSATRSTSC